MALRSLAFDRAAIQYLTKHPAATVVALAEGLQTSYWRLDKALPSAEFRWLSIDLAPVIELRRQLLPSPTRIRTLAQSALDYSWMDEVDDRQRSLHHRRRPADVPAAGRGNGTDRTVRQAISGCPDDIRPATGAGQEVRAEGSSVIGAIPRSADAVQPVGLAAHRPREHRSRNPGCVRPADAARSWVSCSERCFPRSGGSARHGTTAAPTRCCSSDVSPRVAPRRRHPGTNRHLSTMTRPRPAAPDRPKWSAAQAWSRATARAR